MNRQFRHTKVIFTIGPASNEKSVLEEILYVGADICRINMAHAEPDWVIDTIARVREVSNKHHRPIAIMMDIKGPEIRTGIVKTPINLKANDLVDFVLDPDTVTNHPTDIPAITVNYPNLDKDLSLGSMILVDNGLLQFELLEKHPGYLRSRTLIPGTLTSRRHINLPGTEINLPAITEKDKRDIALGVEQKVEFFALSFVRKPNDITSLRKHLEEKQSAAHIIAKVEDQSAITHLDEIIANADSLMVARGDLGIECPYEQLPLIQRRAVQTSILLRKPVIIATHMLESMIHNPVPTRAEVSDVANAVLEQADAVMLSGETTTGKYPIECIRVMNRIALELELSGESNFKLKHRLEGPKEKLMKAAIVLAKDLKEGSIIVFTRTGYLPQVLSSMRPNGVPIYAFTENSTLYRQMLLMWGIEPCLLKFSEDPEITISNAIRYLSAKRFIMSGEWQVVITNALAEEQIIDSIQLRMVD